MTRRSELVAVALLVMEGAVLAQTPRALPAACPFAQKLAAPRLPGSGMNTLSAGSGIIECKPSGCQISVNVASYKPEFRVERCCSYIEQGVVVALKKLKKDDPPVDLSWVLVPAEVGIEYVFASVNPIIVSPAAQPNDFDSPKFKKQNSEMTLPSGNSRFAVFNYGLTIFRVNADGTYLACDPNDPVIVNQGN